MCGGACPVLNWILIRSSVAGLLEALGMLKTSNSEPPCLPGGASPERSSAPPLFDAARPSDVAGWLAGPARL